jgi:uncharacterized phage infection (PIP) family protein YhgE
MDTNPDTGVAADDAVMALLDEPTPEPEREEDEAPAVGAQTEDDTDDEQAAESEQDQPRADLEEVEIDGEKLVVPKKIAEAVMRQQDYTKKTQEVADRRRLIEDKEQYLEAREKFVSAASTEWSELQAIESQLAQFQTVDLNAIALEDTARAVQLMNMRQTLLNQRAEKASKLQQVAQAVQQAQQAHQAQQAKLAIPELERRIGKLDDKKREALAATAAELGIPGSAMWSPEVLHAVDLAAKYLALQKAKPQQMKKVAQAPQAIKPQAAPPRVQQNKSALDRLKQSGRPEDLMKFL